MSFLKKGTKYELRMTKRAGILEKTSTFAANAVVNLIFLQGTQL